MTKWFKRIAIGSDMLAAFAMAGFAGDPELSHHGVPLVAFNKLRQALGDVAIHAGAIP